MRRLGSQGWDFDEDEEPPQKGDDVSDAIIIDRE
jgi:hypothetical protein